ncbi:MAG: ZPR1 zinc finger domain-containing protein [Candidatus Diapherotrites archaeon]|nr:ZPR1 zinc finger domain-containing protein [Candidatus Micrarchaeota archaeon]MBU1939721.1 ZPR1 zinc finger domain-containing protein [Candidatus Micrarchaeota archaeon]
MAGKKADSGAGGAVAEIPCANCGAKAGMSQIVRNVPHFGEVVILTLRCAKCGFKFVDVFSAGVKEPMRFTAKVNGTADLRTRIIRSSSSTVRIPELGVEIEPAAMSEGYISNIEGVLDRVEGAARILAKSAESGGMKNAERALEKIRMAREGKVKFTIILEDPLGNGALVGKGVKRERLSAANAKRLNVPMQVFEIGKGGKKKAGKKG